MSYWKDVYMRHEQMIDRRQQTAYEDLVSLARVANPRTNRVYGPLMALLGRRLTLWGNRLETQFGH